MMRNRPPVSNPVQRSSQVGRGSPPTKPARQHTIRWLLLTSVSLSCLMAALTGSAASGSTWAWSSGYPQWIVRSLSGTHANVSLYTQARYQGSVRPIDVGRSWHINTAITSVEFNAPVGQPNGQPASGTVTSVANQVVVCGASCGASVDVLWCDDHGGGNTVNGAAEVIIAADVGTHFRTTHSKTLPCSGGDDEGGPDNELEPPDPPPISPIILDLDRNHFHLAGPDDSVMFDIDGNGLIDELTWTQAGQLDAFLVLDVNQNGMIDNGTELFGNNTWVLGGSKAAHGFIALAQYDANVSGGNEDGIIDSNDFIFAELRLWIDEDHDGIADDVELFTLAEKQITRLELDFREDSSRDRHGNLLTYTSRAWQTHGNTERPVRATDVFFVYLE